MLRDSGLYNCIATSGGLASSHVIELVVEGRVRKGYICQYNNSCFVGFNVSRASTVEYLRFSKPARLVHPFIDQLVKILSSYLVILIFADFFIRYLTPSVQTFLDSIKCNVS